MKYSKINQEHFNSIKQKIKKLEFKTVLTHFLETYNNKYELFTKNRYSSIWYETLLSQFTLALDSSIKVENRLSTVIDLQVRLEIRSQEIIDNPSSMYKYINLKDYNLVA